MNQPMIKRLPAILLISGAIATSVSSYAAPLIDVTVTAAQWQADYSGNVGQDDETATLDELGFDDDDHNVVALTFEHPVPFLPNVRIQNTNIDTSASGTISRDLTFNDVTFSASEDVETALDLSHTDFTFFYSPLNNWVHLDLGLTGRKFDGEASIEGSVTGQESADLDVWIPMIYAGARFELPLTGVYIDATLNTIGYDGNELTDFTAAVGYQTDGLAADFIAELGYRSFSIEIDDIDDIEADLELDGIFLRLGVQF